jgi:hypothetical protein
MDFEWQPARFIDAHNLGSAFTRRLHGKRVRVRIQREHGSTTFCDARRILELHPEDAGTYVRDGERMNFEACEHEILTD